MIRGNLSDVCDCRVNRGSGESVGERSQRAERVPARERVEGEWSHQAEEDASQRTRGQ